MVAEVSDAQDTGAESKWRGAHSHCRAGWGGVVWCGDDERRVNEQCELTAASLAAGRSVFQCGWLWCSKCAAADVVLMVVEIAWLRCATLGLTKQASASASVCIAQPGMGLARVRECAAVRPGGQKPRLAGLVCL